MKGAELRLGVRHLDVETGQLCLQVLQLVFGGTDFAVEPVQLRQQRSHPGPGFQDFGFLRGDLAVEPGEVRHQLVHVAVEGRDLAVLRSHRGVGIGYCLREVLQLTLQALKLGGLRVDGGLRASAGAGQRLGVASDAAFVVHT